MEIFFISITVPKDKLLFLRCQKNIPTCAKGEDYFDTNWTCRLVIKFIFINIEHQIYGKIYITKGAQVYKKLYIRGSLFRI